MSVLARSRHQLQRHALRPALARTPAMLAKAFAARHQLMGFFSLGEIA